MLVRVTCAGVLVGTAQFDPPRGLAHASLDPTPGYASAASAAQRLGRQLATTQFWSPRRGDFADAAGRQWDGGRLALEDETGRELGVNSVVLLEGLADSPGPAVRIVADFRFDLARAEAQFRTRRPGDGDHMQPNGQIGSDPN